MHIVIAGGGPAAAEAAIAIRQYDQMSTIDLYSAENVHPYRRPLLPKVLSGEFTKEKLLIQPPDFYVQHNINIHLAERVLKVDPTKQTVTLQSNEVVAYDRLLLAVGRKSRRFAVAPDVQDKILTLHSIADVEKINSLLNRAADITVIGGGILGLECADALLKRNFKVNIIEQHNTLMRGILDDNSALFLQQQLLEHNKNLTIYTSCTLRQLVKHGNKAVCYLSNPHNKVFYSDLIISAIGLEPCRDWGFPLETDRFLQIKNCRNIFGAGDCVSICGKTSNFYKEARMQGRIAGANITGQKQEFMFQPAECRSMFNNIPFYSAGITDPATTESLTEYNGNTLKKLFYQHDCLVGCILIGNTQDSGDIYSIISKHHHDLR